MNIALAWLSLLVLMLGRHSALAQVEPSSSPMLEPFFYHAQRAGGTSNDFAMDIVIDSAGNTYLTGTFYQSAAFGDTNLVSVGAGDIYLAKYNPAGNFLWVKQAGSTNDVSGGSSGDVGFGLAVDGSNNVFVTGYFSGKIDFGGGTTLTSSGGNETFVTKYSPDGTVLWAKRAGGAHHDVGLQMRTDSAGSVYLVGFFRATSTFGTNTLVAAPSDPSNPRGDMYLAKFDANGNNLFAVGGGGSGDDVSYDLGLDAVGNIYVSGYFQNNATFSSTNLVSGGGNDAYLAKYASSGTLLWIKKISGTGTDMARALAVDVSGNSYVTGSFENTISFGSTNLTSSASNDIFIAKYNANGDLLWTRRAGGDGSDTPSDIQLDPFGNLYISGQFASTATFGPTILTATSPDIFVACLGTDGDFVWARSAGSSGDDIAEGLALDLHGRVEIAGRFAGLASFDSISLTNVAGNDIFFAKLGETPRLNSARSGNQLIVFWPERSPDSILQTTTNLTAQGWINSPLLPQTSDGAHHVTDTISGNRFYRLKK